MNVTIYIAQLNHQTTTPKIDESFLLSLFQPYGKLVSLAIANSNTLKGNKSIAYVTFVHKHDAITAIRELNFKYVPERKTRIVVKEANNYTAPTKSDLESKKFHYSFI